MPRSSDAPECLGDAVGVSRQDDTPTAVGQSRPAGVQTQADYLSSRFVGNDN